MKKVKDLGLSFITSIVICLIMLFIVFVGKCVGSVVYITEEDIENRIKELNHWSSTDSYERKWGEVSIAQNEIVWLRKPLRIPSRVSLFGDKKMTYKKFNVIIHPDFKEKWKTEYTDEPMIVQIPPTGSTNSGQFGGKLRWLSLSGSQVANGINYLSDEGGGINHCFVSHLKPNGYGIRLSNTRRIRVTDCLVMGQLHPPTTEDLISGDLPIGIQVRGGGATLEGNFVLRCERGIDILNAERVISRNNTSENTRRPYYIDKCLYFSSTGGFWTTSERVILEATGRVLRMRDFEGLVVRPRDFSTGKPVVVGDAGITISGQYNQLVTGADKKPQLALALSSEIRNIVAAVAQNKADIAKLKAESVTLEEIKPLEDAVNANIKRLDAIHAGSATESE